MKLTLSNNNSILFKDGKIKVVSKKEEILYTAVVLTPASQNKLKKAYPPKHDKEFYHHLTINFGRGQKLPENIGKMVTLNVVGYQEDFSGQAVVVQPPFPVKNKVPHITLSTAAGVPPKYSNDMLAEGYLKIDPIPLEGQIVAYTTKNNEIRSVEDFNRLNPDQANAEYQVKSEGFIIYCDMDGVLTDFAKKFIEYYHQDFRQSKEYLQDPESYPEIPAARSVNDIANVLRKKKYVVTTKAPLSFWADMEWMSDGKTLWNTIKKLNPIILSTPATSDASKQGKRKWVRQHLGNYDVILSDKKHEFINNNKYVPKESIGKNKILIDDTKKNIDKWKAMGGIGILHKSASETIAKLKKLGVI